MDAIECSECANEAADANATEAELELEGWDFAGEFGPRCPSCLGENVAPTQSEGLDGVAEALAATKEE